MSSVVMPSQVRPDVDGVLGLRSRLEYVKNRNDDRRDVVGDEASSSCDAQEQADEMDDADDSRRAECL